MKILVTGANGYIGSQLLQSLILENNIEIIATDIHPKTKFKSSKIKYRKADLSTNEVYHLICEEKPNVVVHLAAIVTPTKNMTIDFMYQVEVVGTEKIMEACINAGVQQFINTSSGAAYGYYEDHPEWLKEEDPIRGNEEFIYAKHKRLNEDIFKKYRKEHPQLKQLIFRVSTILGEHTQNDITALFHKKKILGIKGFDTPFVIIWDKDLVAILKKGILEKKRGIFNVAGDGFLTLKEIAKLTGKKYNPKSLFILKRGLRISKILGITKFGPEQLKFLQYRPVLDNSKLKNEFKYIPQKNTKEAFLFYASKNELI